MTAEHEGHLFDSRCSPGEAPPKTADRVLPRYNMIRYRGKRKAHAAWGNIRKVALVGSPDAKAKANLLPSILSPKKPDDADASPKKPTTRDPIDVDPSDIDPVDRLFVRRLLVSGCDERRAD